LLRQARVARARGPIAALFTTSLVMLTLAPAVAADKVWTGAVDGNFTTGGNWIGGTPGSTDRALYDVGGGGTSVNSNVNASININSILLQGGYAGLVTNLASSTITFSTSISVSTGGFINAGTLTGAGTFDVTGGQVLLGGTSNYTGATTIAGPGLVFAGSATGLSSNSAFAVGTGATLDLGGFSNTIGSLADTGTTAVNGGVLQVDGSIATSIQTTVNDKGVLSGTGAVGNTTVAYGGAFAPGGGTAGTSMTVSGNLAFQSGALYLVQLNSTTSSFANVSGSAVLNGTVGALFAPGSTVLKQYTIMTTGSHTGTFSSVNAPGGLVGSISFDPFHVFLNFALDFGSKGGTSTNQQNVGNTLTNVFNTTGGIPLSFASLTSGQLSQVAGELATGSQQATFDAMNLFLGLLTDPFIDGRGGFGGTSGAAPFAEEGGGANGYAANRQGSARDAFARFATKADVARNDLLDPRWSVWGSAYGGGSNTQGNGTVGSQSATARAFGFAAGADYRISPDTLVGFALAGGGTNFSVAGFGTGRSDLFQAGAFVRKNFGAAYVTAAAAYGWQDVTTDRTVTVAGVDRLRAEFNANAWSGRVEAGYRYATPWMGITPYAAGQFTTYSLPAYAEQLLSGAGTFALNYAAKDVTASRTEFGVRTDKSFAMSNGILTLRGRAA